MSEPIRANTTWALLACTLPTVWMIAAFAPVQAPIAANLGEGAAAVRLTQSALTLPALALALFAPLSGILGDRIGRRRLLLGSLGLYALVGPTGLWASSLDLLLVSRALLGVAVAGIITALITLIGDYYEGDRQLKVMGWQSAVLEFGGAAFSVVAGLMALLSWRAPFAIYLFALPILLWVAVALPEPKSNQAVDHSSPRPALDRRTRRRLSLVYALAFVGMTLFFSTLVHLPFHMTDLGFDAAATGLVMGCAAFVAAIAALLLQRLDARVGLGGVLILAAAALGVGFLFFGVGRSLGTILVGAVLSGAGVGLFLPSINLITVRLSSSAWRSRAVAGLMTFQFLGQFLCPYLTSPIADQIGRPGLFQLVAFSFGAILIVLLIARRAQTSATMPIAVTDTPAE